MDYKFDKTNNILVCRWQDNKEVTAMTNYDGLIPTKAVRRWQKRKVDKKTGAIEEGKYFTHQQPALLNNYNRGMGGVDLHDNAVQNYRINIRSKKWYWPLFITCIDSSVVNAWKLHCFMQRFSKEKIMSQKDFRVVIATALLLASDSIQGADPQDLDEEFSTVNLPKVFGEHIVIKQQENKYRRCKYCHKTTINMCQKCNAHLHTKCLENFHNQK